MPSRWFNDLSLSELPGDFPVLIAITEFEHYVAIQLLHGNQYDGSILLGPYAYCDNKLLHMSALLYFMIYEKKLDITEISQKNGIQQTSSEAPIENIDLNLSNRRLNVAFHHTPIEEKRIFQCIREGRTEDLLRLIDKVPEEQVGILSKKSRLRSKKNLAIASITLATRAAMDGGLFPEVAYTMSDLYIQHIEELADVKDVIRVRTEALCDFANRVLLGKERHYSKPIALCINTVFNHLYEELTLNRISQIVGLSAGYLSQLFRKEVGMTISEYIQGEKIEEAKKLLALTNYSISEICTRLNFHDQSYFTKVFKKKTGVTPRQYRIH
ncbi:AraC family transcriptional regulator [Paenibacillus sp. GCM10027628]|uniref:AraC family transcriptional regulator n=1 Tax=Paenibacillus sp. GCM10027628 TaxID=3273413 RepID=UPI00362C5FC6